MVETSCGDVAVTRSGTGPPVVLLHASPGSSADYAAIIEPLTGRHEVIAIDWPSFGSSPPPTRPLTAAALGDLARELLMSLELGPAVLVGNSIGGHAAISVSASDPESVRGLVLVAPAGYTRQTAITRAFCRWPMGAPAATAFLAPKLAKRYLRHRNALTKEIVRRAGELRSNRPRAVVVADLWRSFAEPLADLSAVSVAPSIPKLLLWGRKDPILSIRRDGRRAATSLRTDLVALETGHEPYAEAPDLFLRHLQPFLDRLDESE